MEGLKVFDKEECGKILSAELRHILLALGERLSTEEVDELLKGVEDSEGLVNYERTSPLQHPILSETFRIHQESHGRTIPRRLNPRVAFSKPHKTLQTFLNFISLFGNSNVIKSFCLIRREAFFNSSAASIAMHRVACSLVSQKPFTTPH